MSLDLSGSLTVVRHTLANRNLQLATSPDNETAHAGIDEVTPLVRVQRVGGICRVYSATQVPPNVVNLSPRLARIWPHLARYLEIHRTGSYLSPHLVLKICTSRTFQVIEARSIRVYSSGSLLWSRNGKDTRTYLQVDKHATLTMRIPPRNSMRGNSMEQPSSISRRLVLAMNHIKQLRMHPILSPWLLRLPLHPTRASTMAMGTYRWKMRIRTTG